MGKIDFFDGISEENHIDIGEEVFVVIFYSEQAERKFTFQTACLAKTGIEDNAVLDTGKGFSDGGKEIFCTVLIEDIFVSVILVQREFDIDKKEHGRFYENGIFVFFKHGDHKIIDGSGIKGFAVLMREFDKAVFIGQQRGIRAVFGE